MNPTGKNNRATVKRKCRQRYDTLMQQDMGNCVNCWKPRGLGGTKSRCRPCAEKWNRYQREGAISEK